MLLIGSMNFDFNMSSICFWKKKVTLYDITLKSKKFAYSPFALGMYILFRWTRIHLAERFYRISANILLLFNIGICFELTTQNSKTKIIWSCYSIIEYPKSESKFFSYTTYFNPKYFCHPWGKNFSISWEMHPKNLINQKIKFISRRKPFNGIL